MTKSRREIFHIATRQESNFKWRYFDPKIDRRTDIQISHINEVDKTINMVEKNKMEMPNDAKKAALTLLLSGIGITIAVPIGWVIGSGIYHALNALTQIGFNWYW